MDSLDPPAIKHMISNLLSASPAAPPVTIPTNLDLPPNLPPNAHHASPLDLLASTIRALYAPNATFVHPLFVAHGHAQITAMYAQWRALYSSTRVDYQSMSVHLHAAGDLSRDTRAGTSGVDQKEDQAQFATVLVECTQYPQMVWPIQYLLATKWVPARLHLVAKLQLMRSLVPVDIVEAARSIFGGPSPMTQEVTIMQQDHRVYVRRWVIVEHTDFYASNPIALVMAPRGFWWWRTVVSWLTLGVWSLLSCKWVKPVADWLARVEWNPQSGVAVMDLDGGGKADKMFDRKEE
ncbi:hypothetical protein BCR44DRAFT_47516 [Catenaria anguillulae PL171]|uniref:Uncharacterized protein n=1 Tax=Catenaria anguillulae PL171 TaxID=765915 RepID=A0A1Y2HV18_9FUNG|nr:hypothetical protein BCR44DRAFT_47516 [Catenaria anguillulae PL171]